MERVRCGLRMVAERPARSMAIASRHLAGVAPEVHNCRMDGRPSDGSLIATASCRANVTAKEPNGWFGGPRDLIPAFNRIGHVSARTVAIVAGITGSFFESGELTKGECS